MQTLTWATFCWNRNDVGIGASTSRLRSVFVGLDHLIEAWLGLSLNGPWLSLPTMQLDTEAMFAHSRLLVIDGARAV